MSDTFYLRQQNGGSTGKKIEQKRKLKKDYIADVNTLLGKEVDGLDKCTIPTLRSLYAGISNKLEN
jgi:hypothetical protein